MQNGHFFVLPSFCPSLKVLSKMMRLSEGVAGVTLLAFGNGAPDLFVCFAAINHEHAQLYSELLGAACFVTALVAGTIVLINPFKLIKYAFTRDCTFFIFALLLIDYSVVTDNVVTITESLGIDAIQILVKFF